MATEILKKFGKYFLLDLIAQGGMAEVYRARMATPDGGARLVAIKRVLNNFSQNAEFVSMFKSEIKTTSGFTHPNIVQIYDYGEEQDQLYLAMEVVDGKNLRQFISRSNELKTHFPVEVCIYIIEQAAAAMAYAHNFKDKFTGKSLNIVHRDISPQNILISYDGAVKVIDFGIAKAVTNVEATRAGMIKGKPSYLSPEQISGETLDGRSDLFALGIVLWELLTGKKLFAADNDYGVLRLIENCTSHVKPPSTINPQVPKDLDAIVLKCLQKNRDNRYLNAEEMQRALHKFLYQFSSEFNPTDLAYYARDLFKNEIVEDRQQLLRLNEKSEKLLNKIEKDENIKPLPPTPDVQSPLSGTSKQTKETGSFRMLEVKKEEKSNVHLDFSGTGMIEKQVPRPAAKINIPTSQNANSAGAVQLNTPAPYSVGERRKDAGFASKLLSTPVVLGAFIIGLGAYYYIHNVVPKRNLASTPVKGVLKLDSNVHAATVSINGKELAYQLPATLNNIDVDQPLKVSVASNGYKNFYREVKLSAGEVKTIYANLFREDGASSVSQITSSDENQLQLQLNIQPVVLDNSTQIWVQGKAVNPLDPKVAVPLDQGFIVQVERDGYRTFRKEYTMKASDYRNTKEASVNIKLDELKFGFISIITTPSADAFLTIDQSEVKIATPVSKKRVPVGKYDIKLVNSLLGLEKNIQVTVHEDRLTSIEERLVTTQNPRSPGSE